MTKKKSKPKLKRYVVEMPAFGSCAVDVLAESAKDAVERVRNHDDDNIDWKNCRDHIDELDTNGCYTAYAEDDGDDFYSEWD